MAPTVAAHAVAPSQLPASQPSSSGHTGGRDLRLSHIVDPTLNAGLVSLPASDVRQMFAKYLATRGGNPDKSIEPTHDQLSAVKQLLECDVAPYVDFAIFGPYGRRLLEDLTFYAFIPQPDGSWARRQLDGPSSYE